MPELNELSEKFSGPDFEVVTIASGHNPIPAIKRFYDNESLDHLPILMDPKSRLSREMRVLSLPITILINPDGTEIARMKGEANWFSDSAQSIVRTLISSMSGAQKDEQIMTKSD
jgi:hypothetical protein